MMIPILLSAACVTQDPFGPLDQQVPFFTLEISPASDLWSEVVHHAHLEGEIEEGPLASATRAARDLHRLLASPRMWAPITGAAITAEPGQWLSAKVVLTKRMMRPGSTRREVRAGIDLLLAEMDSAAPGWLENEWPARQAVLNEHHKALAEALNPTQAEDIWNRIDRWLTLTRPEKPYPIYLVTRSAPPGGTTVMSSGIATCLVATEGRGTSLLADVALHELMHALETLPGNPPPIFSDVLKMLAYHGVRNPEVKQDWVHTLYYIAAAQLVRDVIDPEHVSHLTAEGQSADSEEIHAALLPIWSRYVDGLIARRRFCEEVGLTARQVRDQ